MTLFMASIVVLVLALFVAIVYGLMRSGREREKDEWRAQREHTPEAWRLGPDEREAPR